MSILHSSCQFFIVRSSPYLCYSTCFSSSCSPVDITVYKNGFHGDLNETFFVGEVDEGAQKLVRVAHECLMKGISIGKGLSNERHWDR